MPGGTQAGVFTVSSSVSSAVFLSLSISDYFWDGLEMRQECPLNLASGKIQAVRRVHIVLFRSLEIHEV